MKRGLPILMLAVVLGATVMLPSAGASLAASPWSMRGHDAKRTDRSSYSGPSAPSKKWESYQTSGDVYQSPAIGSDGTIYLGGVDNKIHAINPADGSKKWEFSIGDWVGSPAIGIDGTIYVGSSIYMDDWDSRTSTLYAINPADGSKKWESPLGIEFVYDPAIGSDGTIYVGSDEGRLYAINPADGSRKWTFAAAGALQSPAIGSDDTIYVGSDDNKLYAINPADGSQKWTFAAAGALQSPAIGSDDTIYVSSDDNKLYAINPTDGSQKWAFTTGRPGTSPAIGGDGTIYVGCFDDGALNNKLYAINPADGSKKWEFAIRYGAVSSPVIGSDGTIYVGSTLNTLLAIGRAAPKYSPTLSNPVAPASMSRTGSYTVYATIRPRHTAGSYPVRIYKYRYVSGKWQPYGYVKAKAANYSSYTRCSVRLKLTTKGKWRLRTYAPADSAHVAKWSSGYDYVNVK